MITLDAYGGDFKRTLDDGHQFSIGDYLEVEILSEPIPNQYGAGIDMRVLVSAMPVFEDTYMVGTHSIAFRKIFLWLPVGDCVILRSVRHDVRDTAFYLLELVK